jgi:ABC-type bacteriocin/lantibiotic exporter with double-glycine peptidase domain
MIQVVNGSLQPGSLLAVLALTGVLMAPLGTIVLALDEAQNLRPTLDQIADVMDADTESDFDLEGAIAADVEAPIAPATLRGELKVNDVTFGYSHLGPALISNLDLLLLPGRRVALVGPSGCGKSTISRLVTGRYRPWSGEVLIDGLPRSRHAPQVLTDGIALVDQDVSVFSGTIRDNITLWDPTVPEDDILQSLEDAQLADDVAKRAGGLDSLLAEGGADRVIVLVDGRVAQQGSFDELMAQVGHFRDLAERQLA